MLDLVAHPHLLIAAAILAVPALFPLARFFFTDFDTFRRDADTGDVLTWILWWFGWPVWMYRSWYDDNDLELRILLFLACYAAVVAALYHLFLKLGHF